MHVGSHLRLSKIFLAVMTRWSGVFFNSSMCSSKVHSYYTLLPSERKKALAQNIDMNMWLRGIEALASALLPSAS